MNSEETNVLISSESILASSEWTKIHYFQFIPDEVLLLLFSFIDSDTLLSVAQVCQNWNIISQDNRIWKSKFEQASIWPADRDLLKELNGSWKKLYLVQLMHLDLANNVQHILICRQKGGFKLTPLHQIQLQEILSIRNRYLKTSLDIPYFARNMTSIIQWAQECNSPWEIISVPHEARWQIKRDSHSGQEWIEEDHRKWKADMRDSTRPAKRNKVERQRRVVVDIGHDHLHFSEEALQRLMILTKCYQREHLLQIPRDHHHLLQVMYELGERAGSTLKIVSIPIDVDWFIGYKESEYVCESFRIWPEPYQRELGPHCVWRGNRIVSSAKSKREWEMEKDRVNVEGFDFFTESMEKSWTTELV